MACRKQVEIDFPPVEGEIYYRINSSLPRAHTCTTLSKSFYYLRGSKPIFRQVSQKSDQKILRPN